MARGPLRIATDIQQSHIDPGAVSSNLPSTGIEKTMASVAGEFGKIGDRIGKLADHAAAIEGEQAGKIAGMDPEFRPTNQMTIRGEAYDRAGLQIWTSNARVAISGELEAAWDKHQGSPASLDKAIGEVRGRYMANVPDQVKPEFEILFRSQHKTYMRQAARQQAARIAAEHKAATEAEIADRLKAVQQRAGGLGLDGEADAILADDMRGLAGALSRKGPDGKPVYSPSERRRLLAGAEESVTTSRLIGAFSRLPSTEAKAKFIQDLQSEWQGRHPTTGKPILWNGDGSIATEESITVEIGGRWVNLPTIVNGKRVSQDDAVRLMTEGKNDPTGSFDTVDQAEAAARSRSEKLALPGRGLARVYDLDGIRRVTNHLEGELRQARTEDDAVRRGAMKEVTSFNDAIERGIPIAEPRQAAIDARVAAIGDPELTAQWEDSKALMAWQSTARRMTPAQLDAVVRAGRDELAGGISDPRRLRHLKVAESLLTEMRGELKRDPLGWAERVKLVGQVTPLDASPENAEASFSARASQAEAVAAHYGQAPVYLRPDEKALVATRIAQGGGEGLAAAAAIVSGFGPDRALSVMGEVADHAPAIAMLGGLVAKAGPVEAARDAADGFAIRKQPDYKSLTPQEGAKVREAAKEALGGALGSLPDAESAAVTLANAIYEVRARRAGITEFSPEIWKKGLREALGERTIAGEKYGGIGYPSSGWVTSGFPVVVPPDVKASAIGTIVDAVRMEDLISEHGDRPKDERGRDVSMATVRGATLVTEGDGRYRLATGDPLSDEPRWIRDSSGRPFILDLNRLGPRLRQRVPDAFLGGAR